MRWLWDLAPSPLRTLAVAFVVAAALLLVFLGLGRLWGEVGGLAAVGAIAVGIAIWELAWERPRAARRHLAALNSRQQAPGSQPLHSETGVSHWSERLPQPLGAITTSAPLTLGALVVLVSLLAVFGLLGGGGPEPWHGRLHVPLAVGSSGEVRPIATGKDRLKVTILRIAEGAEVDIVSQSPRPGSQVWGVEVEVENSGEREFQAPGWTFVDSEGRESEATTIYSEGVSPFPLAPGDSITHWVVFDILIGTWPQHVRVIPVVPHEPRFSPREISFDAE